MWCGAATQKRRHCPWNACRTLQHRLSFVCVAGIQLVLPEESLVSQSCSLGETSTWPSIHSKPYMVTILRTWSAFSHQLQPLTVITPDKPPQEVPIFPCPGPTLGKRPSATVVQPCGIPCHPMLVTHPPFLLSTPLLILFCWPHHDSFAWSFYHPKLSLLICLNHCMNSSLYLFLCTCITCSGCLE